MTGEILHNMITSQLASIVVNHDGDGESWLALPNTQCQVGFDGVRNMLRIPITLEEATNWNARNSLIMSRISSTNSSFIHLGFDPRNANKLAPFLVELVIAIDGSGEDPKEVLERMIGLWSGYWSESAPVFGKEDQIGTLGELLVLEKILDCVPEEQVLNAWKAPQMNDDLHDFEGVAGNLEVKTSSSVPRSIYVSSLDQMDYSLIAPKTLTIVFVKLNHGNDFTLPSIVDRLREKCSEIGNSVAFEKMLKDRGYRDFESDVYAEMSFELDSIEQHLVSESTPIYTNSDINTPYSAVAKLSQVIKPDEVEFSSMNSDDWASLSKRMGL